MKLSVKSLEIIVKISAYLLLLGLIQFLYFSPPPKKYAIYIPPMTQMQSVNLLEKIASQSVINAVVLDYNDPFINPLLRECKKQKLYTIVRVVVFPEAVTWQQLQEKDFFQQLKQVIPSLNNNVLVNEIQLDYIRFKDDGQSDKKRTIFITQLIKFINQLNVSKTLSIDVFGRLETLEEDDIIGQSIKTIQSHVDVICPMLYPSHFNKHPDKMANPYRTIKEGINNIQLQINRRQTVVRPYLQAFTLNLTGIPYKEYIRLQILAAEEMNCGYAFWSMNGDYQVVFEVLEELKK
jgi:hypothetical protein